MKNFFKNWFLSKEEKNMLQTKTLNDFLRGWGTYSNKTDFFTTTENYMNSVYNTPYTGNAVSIICNDISKLGYMFADEEGNELNHQAYASILAILNENNTGSIQNLIRSITSSMLLDKVVIALYDKENFNVKINILNPATVTLYGKSGNASYVVEGDSNDNYDSIDRIEIREKVGTKNFSQSEIENRFIINGLQSLSNAIGFSGIIQRNKPIFENARLLKEIQDAWEKNGVISNLFLHLKNDHLSPADFNLIKESFSEQYGGRRNQGKPLILNGIDKITELRTTNQEMQYLDQLKNVRESIYSAFGIPPLFYDASGQFASSLEEQSTLYHENTIPGYSQIVSEIMSILIRKVSALDPRARKNEIYFKFKHNNYKSAATKLTEVQKLVEIGAMNREQARSQLGYATDDDNPLSSVYTLPFSLTTADSLLNPPGLPFEDSSGGDKAVDINKGGCLHHHKVLRADHQRSLSIKRKTVQDKKYLSRFSNAITNYYNGLKERALDGLEKAFEIPNSKALKIEDMFDFEDEVKRAQKEIEPSFISICVAGLVVGQAIYGKGIDPTSAAEPFKNPAFRLVVEKLKTDYAITTLNTRRKELKAIIDTAIQEGDSITQVSSKIKEHFEDDFIDVNERWKADRIARTEIGNGYDSGAQQAYKEAGFDWEMVVGCQAPNLSKWDCASNGESGIKRAGYQWNFKPNHTGCIVPVDKGGY